MAESADTRASDAPLSLFDLAAAPAIEKVDSAVVTAGLILLLRRVAGASEVSDVWEGDHGSLNIGFTYQGRRFNLAVTELR